MTSNDVTPPKHIAHDHPWQTLIEFTLLSGSDDEYVATDRVAEAVQRLNWPGAPLEQLKLTLARAAKNVMERNRLSGSEAPLLIRVLIPKGSETAQAGDQAGNEPGQDRVSDLATQQAGWPSSRGWGFFLVQKQADDPQASAEESPYMIELFLYQENDRSRKYK